MNKNKGRNVLRFIIDYFKRCKIPTRQEIKEYYPKYLLAHRDPANKLIHFYGNIFIVSFVLSILIYRVGILRELFWLPILPFFAWFGIYIFVWPAHRFFEHNVPATFKQNPLLTKACDWVMVWQLFTRKLAWDTRPIKADWKKGIAQIKLKDLNEEDMSFDLGKLTEEDKKSWKD